MQKVTGDWLTQPATQEVLGLLTSAGHQAYAVGGCVRNALLGAPVADVDISTDARPERVAALAEAAGLKVIPTGIEHGTVTILAQDESFEITTFRQDVETDGRRAVVAFASDLRADAERRDFTMNALYARADGTVLDPLGAGIADAMARRIRFVGDAATRIREDYLRILRFFRFTAWYGDAAEGPDPEALAACADLAEGINTLSRERIGAEMRKLLSAPDPAPALAAMQATGVLSRGLPGADTTAMPVLVHLEGSRPPHWLRRLALLGGADPKEALRLSNHDASALAALRSAVEEGPSAAVLGHLLGAEAAYDALLVRAALLGMEPSPEAETEIARGAATAFPIRAADLMPRYSGEALGAKLKELKNAWLESNLRLEPAALLGLLRD